MHVSPRSTPISSSMSSQEIVDISEDELNALDQEAAERQRQRKEIAEIKRVVKNYLEIYKKELLPPIELKEEIRKKLGIVQMLETFNSSHGVIQFWNKVVGDDTLTIVPLRRVLHARTFTRANRFISSPVRANLKSLKPKIHIISV